MLSYDVLHPNMTSWAVFLDHNGRVIWNNLLLIYQYNGLHRTALVRYVAIDFKLLATYDWLAIEINNTNMSCVRYRLTPFWNGFGAI